MKVLEGQKVWVVPRSFRGTKSEPQEFEVTKVGNKYFYINDGWNSKFSISDGIEATDSNYRSYCYLTLQEILDEKEFDELTSSTRSFFNNFGKLNISLEKLRQINELIQSK